MKAKIRLDTQSDLHNFVSIVSGIHDADIKLIDGSGYIVNGKSVLGAMYSMEWDEIYCICDKDIYRFIEHFVLDE